MNALRILCLHNSSSLRTNIGVNKATLLRGGWSSSLVFLKNKTVSRIVNFNLCKVTSVRKQKEVVFRVSIGLVSNHVLFVCNCQISDFVDLSSSRLQPVASDAQQAAILLCLDKGTF